MNQNHLAICIPGESMPIESVRSLGAMLLDLTTKPLPRFGKISQHFLSSSILPAARGGLVRLAVRAGATHILMIDSDMTYPADAARRLIAINRPIAAANATTRRYPIRWVARSLEPAGDALDMSPGLPDLVNVASVGLAFMLVEVCVFHALPQPFFTFEHSVSGWTGEDVGFCRAAREIGGFSVTVSRDVSREIGHVGTRVYSGSGV